MALGAVRFLRLGVPPPCDSVPVVLRLIDEFEVRRVAARRVVTPVPDDGARRDRSHSEGEADAM